MARFLLLLCFHIGFLVWYEVIFVVALLILSLFRPVFQVIAFPIRFLFLLPALLLLTQRCARLLSNPSGLNLPL